MKNRQNKIFSFRGAGGGQFTHFKTLGGLGIGYCSGGIVPRGAFVRGFVAGILAAGFGRGGLYREDFVVLPFSTVSGSTPTRRRK